MILLIIYMVINIWHRSYIISNIRDSQVDFQLKVVVATKPDHPFGFITFRLTNTNYSTLGAAQALLKFFPYFLGEEMAANCIRVLYLTVWKERHFSSVSKVVFMLIQLQQLGLRWLDCNHLSFFCRRQRNRATWRVKFKRLFYFEHM